MASVIIYSTATCPYCIRAKQLLEHKGVKYQEIRVDLDPAMRKDMVTKSGKNTVPQLFINGQSIGGCDDLYALEKQGQLDQFLSN